MEDRRVFLYDNGDRQCFKWLKRSFSGCRTCRERFDGQRLAKRCLAGLKINSPDKACGLVNPHALKKGLYEIATRERAKLR